MKSIADSGTCCQAHRPSKKRKGEQQDSLKLYIIKDYNRMNTCFQACQGQHMHSKTTLFHKHCSLGDITWPATLLVGNRGRRNRGRNDFGRLCDSLAAVSVRDCYSGCLCCRSVCILNRSNLRFLRRRLFYLHGSSDRVRAIFSKRARILHGQQHETCNHKPKYTTYNRQDARTLQFTAQCTCANIRRQGNLGGYMLLDIRTR